MSGATLGGLLGLLFGAGLVCAVGWSPPVRRLRLTDRLTPYLRDAAPPSRLLTTSAIDRTGPLGAAARLLRPALAETARLVERALGGSLTIRRRLVATGSERTVEEFRLEQAIWGFAGGGAGAVVAALLSLLTASVNVVASVLLVACGFLVGVLGRDWWLSSQVRNREQRMLAEFPVVAELLALAVTAGESPAAALERVCRLSGGELARELRMVLDAARTGTPLPVALEGLAERTTLEPLSRFVDGLIIAMERGTPLADVLRAQAADVREAGKRELLAAGGRREIAM